MKKYIVKTPFLPAVRQACLLMSLTAFSSSAILADAEDDPVLSMVLIDEFELQGGEDANPVAFNGQGWVGKDLQKFWYKAEGEFVDGGFEDAELQALYSRAVAPYWDLQVGLRRDFRPSPSKNWAVIGFQGLAPYFFEIDTALFVSDNGDTALRIEAEYELLFTQKLILTPDVEANFYGQSDAELGIGSGLSDLEAGLRLRYEIRREFAPYVGVSWSQQFGKTADYTRAAGEDPSELQWVMGIRAWF